MLIFRGRPTGMSATPYGSLFTRSCARAATALLALTAGTLPLAHAATRRGAPAHSSAATHSHAAKHAPAAAHAVPTHGKAVASRRSARTETASIASKRHAAPANPTHAANGHGRAANAHGYESYTPLSVLSASTTTRHRDTHSAPAVTKRVERHTEQEPMVVARSNGPSSVQATDHAVEDRVHAWYRAQHPGVESADSLSTDSDAVKTAAERVVVGSAAPPAPTKLVALQPDLSPVAHKATTADFTRALQKQTETIRAAAAVNNTRTTAEDDAAFAEASNIPSTAPTERVPAPFVHGDLLAVGRRGASPAKPLALSAKTENAPVVRIDPRGDAEVLSAATGSAVAIHLTPTDAQASPAPLPVAPLRPAAGALAASAKRLDARNADELEDAENDADEKPTVSRPTKPALVPVAGGGYDADLNAGPIRQVNLYDGAGKLILLPAMKGSHEILVHQNQMAIADGLDRIENDYQLADMRRLKLLVALPDNDSTYPDGRLPSNRRFARPWVVRFINDLSRAHYQRFQTPLIVTSAVRTVAFQRRLMLTNGNAAPPTGNVASPHLYGQAIDIAKHGMTVTEIAWLRSYLTPVESSGKIDVEEEFQQACFHISVYRRYLGLPAPRNTPAPEVAPSRVLQQVKAAPSKRRRIPTALLATGLR